jgi:probable HAF family extracellular repeat protein
MIRLVAPSLGLAIGLGAPVARATPAFIGLGFLPGGSPIASQANSISDDGSVVVGGSSSASGVQAFMWTAAGGLVGLGDLPGGTFGSGAHGASADGSVVVGMGSSASGFEAFRRTSATGMVGLGVLPGFTDSQAIGVSADGSVVVGGSGTFELDTAEAFRWTETTGMVSLGNGDFTYSAASGVLADGSVVVGQGGPEFMNLEAFRWTEATGMVGLGFLPGGPPANWSSAWGVSADGSIVVGESYSATAGGNAAFVWDAVNGMRSLEDILVEQCGLGTQLAGWALETAWDVSADGRTIVGSGYNPSGQPEAWIAFLPAPGTAPLVGIGLAGLVLMRVVVREGRGRHV